MFDESHFTIPSGTALNGRYAIEAPLSSGAMGAVYRAWDAETRTNVALKHLRDPRHADRFEVEARLLAMLRHPRVVQVLDHFADDAGQYLVMALVPGSDLGQVLDGEGRPGLSVDRAVEYVRQGAEALQYVHDQQIVHRDVKPQNLILGEQGIVLVDFGIARILHDHEAGTVGVGTPRFMAPEVFAGENVSPRSDVFGLAATLWTLLAGEPPVYARTNLADVLDDAPPALRDALAAGLQVLPERRIASVGAFARTLGATLGAGEGRSLALSVERPAAERSVMEAIVRTAAGVFEASACSIALVDEQTDELVYQAAWGSGGEEIVGVRLPPGQGFAGSVVASGEALAVADCRGDERFAARIAAATGHVPYTMLLVPLVRDDRPIGVLSLLDRRHGGRYDQSDVERGALFADLTVTALTAHRAQ